jgi:integrase
MNTKKQIVRIREKELANGNKSLFLDISWGGKRSKEYLRLYLVNPKTTMDRDANKKTMHLAEAYRAKRQTELQTKGLGLVQDYSLDYNLISYLNQLVESRKESKGNYGNWVSMVKHLEKYCSPETTFADVDIAFVEGFKHYLQTEAKTKGNVPLSKNSQYSYFNKFRASINKAYEDRIIPDNPSKRVKALKQDETHRQYLTLDELKKLSKTECKYPVMKRAFLFSCLTGMRWSDIQKLTWSEVQQQGDGWRVIFRQQKTRGQEYLDIGPQARAYLGEPTVPEERVFIGLRYSGWHNIELQRWIMRAGITKEITFHCGRHTFAVLLLELDTDIYTVSKLLGHRELKTTQVYAKIMDEKKRQAMNKIPDISL